MQLIENSSKRNHNRDVFAVRTSHQVNSLSTIKGYFPMMPRNCFIYGILLCASSLTEAGFVNDTCHEVRNRTDVTKMAKVECTGINTTKKYDPKSQDGSYLWNGIYWEGEIFACLCSCRLPSNLENGKVLSEAILLHGEMLKYECNKDYEKTIQNNIFCYDGLLMTVPERLNATDFVLFRQKSVSGNFSYKFDSKIFDLWVNVSDTWSVPYTKLQQNQKVFQILGNETSLKYYMCGNESCKLGYVYLSEEGPDGKGQGIKNLECKRAPNETTGAPNETTRAPNETTENVSIGTIVGIVVPIVFVIGTVGIVYCCRIKRKKMPEKKSEESGDGMKLRDLNKQASPDSIKETVMDQDVRRSLTSSDDNNET